MLGNEKRILIVDDNHAMHEDIKQILLSDTSLEVSEATAALEQELFGTNSNEKINNKLPSYNVDDAYHGEQALEMVDKASEENKPYSVIFMDIRMSPGMDGIQTIQEIWKRHNDIEIIICTAYSDYSWEDILSHLGPTDRLLFTKKPFNSIAIRQSVLSLTNKWEIRKKNQDLLGDLEIKIIERTEELKNTLSSVEILKKKAEENSEAKSLFLSRISHEIRTPLNGILGAMDLLAITDLNQQQQEYIKIMVSSGEILQGLIENVLDYSKIEAGKIELKKEPFCIQNVVQNTIDITLSDASRKGLKVSYDISTNVPTYLIGDQLHLQQILLNLTNNAIKFTESGGVIISISKEQKITDNSIMLRFEVRDTGIGIEKVKQQKLFTSFSQIDAFTTREYGGTGLGLAISKQLVEMMGGNIGVASKKQQGSTFWFTAVFTITTDDKESNTVNVSMPIREYEVLVVEDNLTNRTILSNMFKKLKIRCDIVSNGQEALDIFCDKTYSAVFIDCHMPVLDGYQATIGMRKLEQQLKRSPVPIIALTGDAFSENQDKCYAAGMTDFLAKPMRLKDLQEIIVKYLGDKELK